MRTFKDNEGREWQVRVDVTGVRDVRTDLDVNLLDLPDKEFALLTRLTTDLVLAVDVLYVLCREQAAQRQVTDEQFGRAMYGDALQAGVEALVRETIDFFPDARRRAMLIKVIDKGLSLGNLMMDRAAAQAGKLDDLDLSAEADRLMAALTATPSANPLANPLANLSAKEPGGSAGSARESSDATPPA